MENLILLLPMLLGVGLAALAGAFDSDDSASAEPEPEPEPEPQPEPEQVQDGSGFVLDGTSGDDRLVLTDPDGGLVDGGGGRDDILVDTGAPPDGLELGWNYDDPKPVRVVVPDPQAGTWTAPDGDQVAVGASHVDLDGDDTLTVGSGFVVVDAQGGGNLIDLSGATQGWVRDSDGDTILGAGAGHAVVAHIGEGTEYRGGAGQDVVEAFETVAPVEGGAGDDVLVSVGGAGHLLGGEGDDHLVGSPNRMEHAPTESDFHEWRIDDAVDTLDGGAGNDGIVFADGDIVTTGTGADDVEGWVTGDGPDSVVTDFDPAQDSMRLIVSHGFRGDTPDVAAFAGRIDVVEADGDTSVLVDGQLAVRLTGVTGASVNLESEDRSFDLTGTPTADAASVTLVLWQPMYT